MNGSDTWEVYRNDVLVTAKPNYKHFFLEGIEVASHMIDFCM